jgi:peroxiredoxin
MNRFKRLFIMPYLLGCLLATAHALAVIIWQAGSVSLAWYGTLLAVVPMVSFIIYLGKAGVSSTSAHLPWQLVCAWAGTALAWYDTAWPATAYATGLGLIGVHTYVFWYSRLNRKPSTALRTGEVLPLFSLQDAEGHAVESSQWRGSPSLLLFYRGNWCPLCVAQVREVAEQYRELAALGVKTVMISPQPARETAKLAARFDAPMQFAVDADGAAARQLGLLHESGLPAGLKGYDTDTVYPTVVLCDSNNCVVWSDQSDNYRTRPEPREWMAVAREKLSAPH